jgi:hypothetical protein
MKKTNSEQKVEAFGSFEPMVRNRFIVYFAGVPAFYIKSVDQPSFILVDGKRKYFPLKMRLYDPIVPNGAQAIMKKLEEGDKTYSFSIMTLDPVGAKVTEWGIKDATLESVIFSNLDWSCKENCYIDLTFTLSEVGFAVY